MVKLNGYDKILVGQRNPITGCIPSAIEWMMRYKGKKVPSDFQERYDLEANSIDENTFKTVSSAVKKDKPKLKFEICEFSRGKDKLEDIQDKISKQIPCTISITQTAKGGWHMCPVVEIDKKNVWVLTMSGDTIKKQLMKYPRNNLEKMHDKWPGGKDTITLL